MSASTRLCVVLLAAAAVEPIHAAEGHLFAAPGAVTIAGFSNGTLHFGGGVEHVFGNGLGIGGEIGAVGSWRNYRSAIGMLSLNGSYHFIRPREKWDPFVTGGYTLGFRSATINFGNFGGGLNYWFGEHIGLRTELRDHVHIPSRGTSLHYWGVRFGVSIR